MSAAEEQEWQHAKYMPQLCEELKTKKKKSWLHLFSLVYKHGWQCFKQICAGVAGDLIAFLYL